MYFITRKGNHPFITWEETQRDALWGMIILFGGGLALGVIINESSATAHISMLVGHMLMNNKIILLLIFTIWATLLSELTNSTVCAAVLTPIVLSTTSSLGLNPIPYWFCLCVAMNAEFLLPISVRAIPVAYGLDPKIMLKKGFKMVVIRFIVCFVYCLFLLETMS